MKPFNINQRLNHLGKQLCEVFKEVGAIEAAVIVEV